MGGRAGGGAGAGRGGGVSNKTAMGRATNQLVSQFSDKQKQAYNTMVANGVNEAYSAFMTAKWKDSFRLQPYSHIEHHLINKVSATEYKSQINSYMTDKKNRKLIVSKMLEVANGNK